MATKQEHAPSNCLSGVRVTQAQRDALLFACDDDVHYGETDWEAAWRLPTVRALADDLLLPDEDGRYTIRSVGRGALIAFLEHHLMLALESGVAGYLPLWHACVSLLDQLGHQVDGDVYEKTVCHCSCCQWRRESEARLEARWAVAADEAEKDDATLEYWRDMQQPWFDDDEGEVA